MRTSALSLLRPFVIMLYVLFGGFVGPAWGIVNIMPEDERPQIIRSEYLVDKSGDSNIEIIRSSLKEDEWRVVSEDSANFGYQPFPYWYRFELYNASREAKDQVIELSYPLLDYLDYYQLSEGTLLQ